MNVRMFGRFGDQPPKVVADHAITVQVGRLVVPSGAGCELAGRVLGNLAKDPWIRRCCAANHHGVAARGFDHRGCIFRRADVAVADDGQPDGVLHRRNPLPSGFAGVALLTRPSMQSDGVQPAIFCELRQLDTDDVGVVPAHPKLDREGDRDCSADLLKDHLDQRQIAQQT